MSEYNRYVLAVNKIFELINQMKEKLPDQDNINYIENIEEYKKDITNNAKLFNKKGKNRMIEELGNDW